MVVSVYVIRWLAKQMNFKSEEPILCLCRNKKPSLRILFLEWSNLFLFFNHSKMLISVYVIRWLAKQMNFKSEEPVLQYFTANYREFTAKLISQRARI